MLNEGFNEGDEAPARNVVGTFRVLTGYISDISAHANEIRKRNSSRGAAAASSSLPTLKRSRCITIVDNDDKQFERLPMPKPVPVKGKIEKVEKLKKVEKVVCKNPSHEDCPGFSPACVFQKVTSFSNWQTFVDKRVQQKKAEDALTDTESEHTPSDETNAAGIIDEYEETQQVEF